MNACPNCEGRCLRINVLFQGTVDIELDEGEQTNFEVTDSNPTDSELVDSCKVACLNCNWKGTMKDIDPPNLRKLWCVQLPLQGL